MSATDSPSYDLYEAGWIDVRWLRPAPGQPSAVGLRDVLVRSHEIAGLAVGPAPALASLYRVLYALTARVTGLDEAREGPDEWRDRREAVAENGIGPEAVDAYFRSRRERFDLFGPTPFVQDTRLRAQCKKTAGTNKLVLGRPAGNNQVWFGHHRDTEPSPVSTPDAALALLTYLYYGPSGRCSTRTVGSTSAAKVYAGPLRSSLSYHPEGGSLLETLLAGLTPPGPQVRRATDPCPWEEDPQPDPLRPPVHSSGLCAQLTGGWQHALLLVPDTTGTRVRDAYIAWSSPHKKPAPDDAYVIWQLSKAGNVYARPADSGRALWRDVDALLETPTGSGQPRRPRVFDDAVTDFPDLRVRALGFEQDGQTRDVQFVSASTPALLDLAKAREGHLGHRIGDARQAAERYGNRLNRAVRQAWAGMTGGKPDDCVWEEEAKARYWPAAEDTFWSLFTEDDFARSRRDFRDLAHKVFDAVTRDQARTCRTMAAREEARLELVGGRRAAASRRQAASAQLQDRSGSTTMNSTPRHLVTTEPPFTDDEPRFVAKVHELCAQPGNRSALRRGLRKPLDQCTDMHRTIAAHVPDHADGSQQRAYYAIASMVASLPPAARESSGADASPEDDDAAPRPTDGSANVPMARRIRNFGLCLAEAVAADSRRERVIEGRLDLLAKQGVEGVHRHLPGIVRLVADRPGAVDWAALLRDLRNWEHRRDHITRRWLQSYYRERARAAHEAAEEADGQADGSGEAG